MTTRRTAAKRFDNREIGSITHFEHVNFRVPDHRLATLFFIEGLGFTRDPTRMVSVRNMWVNAGQQQFHLPLGEAAPFAGEVGVTVPSLRETEQRLAGIARELRETKFSVRRDGETLEAISPWGHRIRVHQQGPQSGRLPQAVPYVRFQVPSGSATGIATFYAEIFSAPVTVRGRAGRKQAKVTVGINQHFHFDETPGLVLPEHPNHVAVYVTAYRSIYDRMRRARLLMAPDRDDQFRFAKLADPESGAVLFEFEHEVRSLHHPDYFKPLANRVPVPYLVD